MEDGRWKIVALFLAVFWGAGVWGGPVPGRGIYVIWYRDGEDLLKVPYVVGGQVVTQWGSVEPDEGRYDFASIGAELAKLKAAGRRATVQINGNRKPGWLFDVVPSHPKPLSVQVNDARGTLMYWHPAHVGAYTNMLWAFSRYLTASADREAVVGIRLNFNAIGTEHHAVPTGERDLSRWVVPRGAAQGPVWSKEQAEAYDAAVVETFVSGFSGKVRVFVRNNVGPEIAGKYRSLFDSGKLGWFHTSSEAEPRSSGTEIQYRRFFEDCRGGKTTAYAEPWASAWGDHGGLTDDRWCSPPQWNYWRLLLDLHCGVSFIALYASDFSVAVKGTYRGKGGRYDEAHDALGYRGEFEEAFRFASRYAGYHAAPEESPGAWVALRENAVIRAANGMPEARRRLSFFTGDYTFLMERLPDKTAGAGERPIGPGGQRFGAWARVLPAGEIMRLALDERFVRSLGTGGEVRVIYLDGPGDAGAGFSVEVGGSAVGVMLRGSGRWETARIPLDGKALRMDHDGAHVRIVAGSKPVSLHMVEVVRQGG